MKQRCPVTMAPPTATHKACSEAGHNYGTQQRQKRTKHHTENRPVNVQKQGKDETRKKTVLIRNDGRKER